MPIRHCCRHHWFLQADHKVVWKSFSLFFSQLGKAYILRSFFLSPYCLAAFSSWLIDHGAITRVGSSNFHRVIFIYVLWQTNELEMLWHICSHGISCPTVNKLCTMVRKPTSDGH